MKPFTLHLQAFLVPSVGSHKLIRPVIPNLSGLVVGTAFSLDSHRKRASHRVSHLGILRSPAQGPLRWPLCLPRPHLMCWGCGCPQTLGPEAWGLGGWVPHSASGPRARPWGSWEVPPVVGMDKGKGQKSPLQPSHWGRSSFWPAEQEVEGWGLHRDHEGRPGGHGDSGCL